MQARRKYKIYWDAEASHLINGFIYWMCLLKATASKILNCFIPNAHWRFFFKLLEKPLWIRRIFRIIACNCGRPHSTWTPIMTIKRMNICNLPAVLSSPKSPKEVHACLYPKETIVLEDCIDIEYRKSYKINFLSCNEKKNDLPAPSFLLRIILMKIRKFELPQ